ncbi:solute carrier family 66 member 3-like [Oppia nitens]|uniref:solute carrier family 66 member 3-like n=1 Tax=Oppia nitens TaxID=1686743 RepID=UPI0023DBFA45|nr:solute carrier family 66 member 3-like [Oppia nitens]
MNVNNDRNQWIYLLCSTMTTVLCLVLKIPQLIALLKSKSSRGLSLQSLVLEFWAYMTMTSYSLANSYPLSMFCEYPILLIQDIIIIYLILHFNQSLNFKCFLTFVLICLFHTSIAIQVIPIKVSVILIQLGNPIGWYSKAIQMLTIVKNKDSGQVSALTWFLNACSCAARLTTLWLSIMDPIVVTTLIVSFFLNTGVAIVALTYRPKIKSD